MRGRTRYVVVQFQFQKVRLKVPRPITERIARSFQFQKVRLKDEHHEHENQEQALISIPKGSIKSTSRPFP